MSQATSIQSDTRKSRASDSTRTTITSISDGARSSGCEGSSRIPSSYGKEVLETLLARYGRVAHMGARDASYCAFLSDMKDGAVIYKVIDKVAIISGDPLCAPLEILPLLEDFRKFCKSRRLQIAMVGASSRLAKLAIQHGWIKMQFAVEKILNPLTNPLLLGTGGKRTVQKCRQLSKAGFTAKVYRPSYEHDLDTESQLVRIYNDWRSKRNQFHTCQAYITVFDMFALHHLMTYIYIKDPQQRIIGFAALRTLGSGFHLDPVVALEDAPSGTTDLLIVTSLSLTRDLGSSRLSLGWEPLSKLEDISGVSHPIAVIMRALHGQIFKELPLEGKRAFHQRFHPDSGQDSATHIIFFGLPKITEALAMLHFANIDMSEVLSSKASRIWQPTNGKRSAKNNKA